MTGRAAHGPKYWNISRTGCLVSYWFFFYGFDIKQDKKGLMILDVFDVEHVEKVWTFDFISLVSYLISKLYVKWPMCLLLNQLFYK